MTSPPILSITEGYAMLHLFVLALGLSMLSLSPFGLLYANLIQPIDCSRLLRSEAFGLLVGSVSIVPLTLFLSFSSFLSLAVPIAVTGCLSLFFMVYDFTFSNMFSQIAESGTFGKPRWGLDLVSTGGFSRMLVVANFYPILLILALLAFSQFVLVLVILVFQAVFSLVGFGLHGLSIKWTQGTFPPNLS